MRPREGGCSPPRQHPLVNKERTPSPIHLRPPAWNPGMPGLWPASGLVRAFAGGAALAPGRWLPPRHSPLSLAISPPFFPASDCAAAPVPKVSCKEGEEGGWELGGVEQEGEESSLGTCREQLCAAALLFAAEAWLKP